MAMKLQLIRNTNTFNKIPYVHRFMSMINQYAKSFTNSGLNKNSNEVNLNETDYELIENYLRVDFLKMDNDVDEHRSGEIKFVIFIDKDSQFSKTSIPIFIFSLDLLIEEKIEMLDASIVTESSVLMMQGIATRLNNEKNILQEALKRHFVKQTQFKNRKSPLW